jgi:catechol 2,3-dioxygenase-like lactoylglutathione lyase family enzyme
MTDSTPITHGIDHLGLTVSDIVLSRRFFVECLGWSVIGGIPEYPAVFVSDGNARLTLWQVNDEGGYTAFDRRKNVGLHHVALKVSSEADLARVFALVSAWPGVDVEFGPEPVGKGPNLHCMIREPGGTRLEFRFAPS